MNVCGIPETSFAPAGGRGYAPAVVALIAGTAVSAAAFVGLHHWEGRRIQLEFESAAHDRSLAIAQGAEEHKLVLESLCSFYAASELVTRCEFRKFVSPFLSRPAGIRALAWIPRVSDAKRAEYEEAAQKDGIQRFQFTEMDSQGSARRAAHRPDYFPVYYAESRRGDAAAVGLDLASDETRLEALRRAMDTGEAVATGEISLFQERKNRFGFLIFLPIYSKGMPTETVPQRRQALHGFVLGVFQLADMVETALSRLAPGRVDVRIEDMSAPADKRLLYVHMSRTRRYASAPADGGAIDTLNDAGYASRYSVCGRTWRILCSPAPGFVTAHRTWQRWEVLICGLSFTALLVGYYFASIRNAVRVQRALCASESRYRSLFHGSPISLREEDYSEVRKHLDQLRAAGVADFREYFRNHPEAVRECAAKVKVRDMNQAGLQLYGAASAEELLAGLASIFTDETYDTFREALSAIVDGTTVFDIETPVQTLQGEKKQVLLRWTVAAGSERTFDKVYISQTDITECRRAEDAALAANRAKSEFLANMSHEIRTPMTAILGFSDLLTIPNLPPNQRDDFLDAIRRNGEALLQLINDILDLSKIEADRLTLTSEDCFLPQIIDEAISVVRIRAVEKRLPLELCYEFPVPERITTDPARLRQILVNLLGNAVKFTERGAVRVTVRCLGNDAGTAKMQFAVSDTGIGIPPGKIRDLFQPFVQVDTSATRRYGGTGLGLAISKRLARALNGDIEVASEPGLGSTFTLTIVVGSLNGVRMLQSPQAASSASETPMPAKQEPILRGRVLLAEDAPDIQMVVRQMLRKTNLEIEVADNGLVACRMAERSKAEQAPYDLILMDMQMPEMNGYEATRWLREHGWEGPILALTAHAMVGDREKCLEAGCSDYVTKPILAARLRALLARHLTPATATASQIAEEAHARAGTLAIPR